MKALKSNGIEFIIIILSFFCAAVIGGCGGDDSTTITPSWLFVQTAPSGTLSSNATAQASGSMAASAAAEYTLTLLDVDSAMIAFSDRPARDVINLTVSDFVAQWNDLGFVDDPPNAALELMEPQGDIEVTIIELLDPVYDGSSLSYTVRPLSSDQSFLESHERRVDSIAEFATNFDHVTLFIDSSSSLAAENLVCGIPFTDSRDGQTYKTVEIGVQCWMAENLNHGTMKNDQSDAGVNDQSDAGVNDQSDAGVNDQSDAGVIEKYCYDNSTSNCGTYGGLYQWNEMMVQGICPAGWHLPTDAEWCKLEQEVDSSIKCNSLHWRGVDGGTELKQGGNSGFQALLAGDRGYDGSFYDLDLYANFWTSSEYDSYVWIRRLSVSNATVYRYVANKSSGVSVRCLKGY